METLRALHCAATPKPCAAWSGHHRPAGLWPSPTANQTTGRPARTNLLHLDAVRLSVRLRADSNEHRASRRLAANRFIVALKFRLLVTVTFFGLRTSSFGFLSSFGL